MFFASYRSNWCDRRKTNLMSQEHQIYSSICTKYLDKIYIETNPFPHLIINDFLPAELYKTLEETYPSVEEVVGQASVASNTRHQISAAEAIKANRLDRVWLNFVNYFVSSEWWGNVLGAFRESILTEHAHLETLLGKSIEQFSTGVRGIDSTDIVLDCQPGINTAVTNCSSVRGPHIDNPLELIGGLLYFRDPEDDSDGSDLLLCRHRSHDPVFWGKAELLEKDVVTVKRVPYAANNLVLFVNSVNAVHAVTPRSATKYPRRLVNIIAEVTQCGGVFKVPRDRSSWGRIRNRWYQYRHGW